MAPKRDTDRRALTRASLLASHPGELVPQNPSLSRTSNDLASAPMRGKLSRVSNLSDGAFLVAVDHTKTSRCTTLKHEGGTEVRHISFGGRTASIIDPSAPRGGISRDDNDNMTVECHRSDQSTISCAVPGIDNGSTRPTSKHPSETRRLVSKPHLQRSHLASFDHLPVRNEEFWTPAGTPPL